MGNQGSESVNVLWTGGWDSTYRVIQLARLGKSITPHYLIDHNRDSAETEISTIRRLSIIINERYGNFINEPKITDSKNLEITQEMHSAFQKILEGGYLGSQYIYLATYCHERGVEDLELCIHKDDKAYDYVHKFVEYTQEGIGYLSNNSPDYISLIFKCFCFPILDTTKLEMEADTKIWGSDDIMEITWFCHQPLFGKPCGSCNPCMYTIAEGLSRRFSRLALIRYTLKQWLLKFPAILKAAHVLKYGRER